MVISIWSLMRITLNITPYSIKQLVQLLERGCLRETYTKTFKNLKSLNRDFIKKRFNKRSHPSKRRMKLIANRIFFKANVEKSIWSLVPLKFGALSQKKSKQISPIQILMNTLAHGMSPNVTATIASNRASILLFMRLKNI